MTDSYASDAQIPFRVRIGVTGHRDPVDSDALRAPVRERLEEIRHSFMTERSLSVTFVLLSSLAEGADRLVAEEARDVLADSGVELYAVLPMSAAEYRKDFADPGSARSFDELLAPPTIRVDLPPTKNRNEAYERAGRYIVDHSDIMVALWDGHPPAGRGGSAEVVDYARRKGVPVLLVPTRRAREPDREPRRPAWAQEPWAPLPETAESLERIEQFNDQHDGRDPEWHSLEARRQRVGAPAEGSRIHWQYELVANWTLPRLVRANELAQRYQRFYYRLGEALFLLAALAVATIAAQSQWHWNSHIALVEVAFMLALLGVYATARHLRVHERWIGYRSLAEALRSALFIVLAGLHPQGSTGVDPLCATDEPWFQRAFSEVWRQRPAVKPSQDGAAELREFLIEGWLLDQIAYHRRAVTRFARGRKRLTWVVFSLFFATVIAGLLHAFEVIDTPFWTRLLTFLAIALPGFGAAFVGIRDQRQYRVHEDRSQRTATRLERLRRELESQTSFRSVQNLAAQIQTVVEGENVDWSGVIEFQDLEMVL